MQYGWEWIGSHKWGILFHAIRIVMHVDMAKLFFRGIVHLLGPPATIVSDWGPQFASTFWGQICSCFKID